MVFVLPLTPFKATLDILAKIVYYCMNKFYDISGGKKTGCYASGAGE